MSDFEQAASLVLVESQWGQTVASTLAKSEKNRISCALALLFANVYHQVNVGIVQYWI